MQSVIGAGLGSAIKSDTRAARVAFLYGNGDGNRVTNVQKLSEMFGIAERTVRYHIKAWEKEFADIAASASETGLALVLSAESLAVHRKNIKFLEEQTAKCRAEIESAESLERILRRAVEDCSVIDEESAAKTLSLVNSFCSLVNGRKSLQTQFLGYQKAWNESSGVNALQDVAVTREKTLASARAKIDVAKENQPPGDLPPALSGARPGAFLDVPSVPPVEADGV